MKSSVSTAAALTLAFLLFANGSAQGPVLASHSSSTIGLLAIDANAGGNTATSLGPLDGCASVQENARVDLDYVVESIPADRPMIGFEVEIRYDPRLLEVVDVDRDLLLGASGSYTPFAGLSDGLPDSDGSLLISVLDTASSAETQTNVETGPGVLARITFRAKAAGLSAISIAAQAQPFAYPMVQDTRNETILADRLGSASVSVGAECPPEASEPVITDLGPTNTEIIASNPQLVGATPVAAPPSPPASATTAAPSNGAEGETPSRATDQSQSGDDGGGSDTALIIVAVLLALAAAAGGGSYLYRRFRETPP